MYTYLLRRVLLLIPTLLIVSVIVFLSVRLIPGDVIDVMFAQMSVSGRANLPSREALEAALGLDRPLHVQYLSWLGDIVLRGDFGDPLMAIEPVAVLIRQRIGVTLELGAMAIIVSLLVSVPVGIYSAVRQDSLADYLARSLAIILVSVPPFWTGTMVMIYPVGVVGLGAVDRAQSHHRGSDRPPGPRAAAGGGAGHGPGRPEHADDAHHDAGSVARRLHPHRLVQGPQ